MCWLVTWNVKIIDSKRHCSFKLWWHRVLNKPWVFNCCLKRCKTVHDSLPSVHLLKYTSGQYMVDQHSLSFIVVGSLTLSQQTLDGNLSLKVAKFCLWKARDSHVVCILAMYYSRWYCTQIDKETMPFCPTLKKAQCNTCFNFLKIQLKWMILYLLLVFTLRCMFLLKMLVISISMHFYTNDNLYFSKFNTNVLGQPSYVAHFLQS